MGAPAASVRASGWTATLNGRSWLAITGVVSRNSGRDAFSAGPRLRANGCSCWSVVALAVANALTLLSVTCVCRSVARELGERLLELGVVGGDRR